MDLIPTLPVLLAGACWLSLGLFYCWQIARYPRRRYLRRTPNYRHFSHLLIACQLGASLFGFGKPQTLVAWANWTQVVGLVFMAAGFAFCIWARWILGPFWDKHA